MCQLPVSCSCVVVMTCTDREDVPVHCLMHDETGGTVANFHVVPVDWVDGTSSLQVKILHVFVRAGFQHSRGGFSPVWMCQSRVSCDDFP